MRDLTEAEQEAATAYHEAGHAWVLYWHFIRKGWCHGVELRIDHPEEVALAMARGLLAPDSSLGDALWPLYAAWSAAGEVAEYLWADGAGIWAWDESLKRNREKIEGRIWDFEVWGLEDPEDAVYGDDDLDGWIRMGQDYEQPISFDLYWRAYKDAEQQLRFAWPTVQALAEALLEKRHLTEAEALAILEVER